MLSHFDLCTVKDFEDEISAYYNNVYDRIFNAAIWTAGGFFHKGKYRKDDDP
jgi:hypothetical protein